MGIQGCVKTVLDVSKYSSPVPVIGLYIAAASLVCFMGMLYDIVSGFLHRKRWLPCQWFSLDSVTLTLLGVAAKIPLDLTTPMPSALDQFSKLSGTTFLCIAMAFLMPSVGMKQASECVNNMVALTIFVVTVIVNICLQIHTGVIFLFVVEHIIIMCCLLGFLSVLWLCILVASSEKESSIDGNKDLFTKGNGSMLERLKVAYVCAFNYNPQFVICRNIELPGSTGLSIICLVVLIRAAIKSLSWEFCRGSSNYAWSMWLIVTIQILTIILGNVASSIRSFALSSEVYLGRSNTYIYARTEVEILSNPLLRMRTRDLGGVVLFFIVFLAMVIVHFCVVFPLLFVFSPLEKMFRLCFEHKPKDHSEIDVYRHIIDQCSGGDRGLKEWVLVKADEDIKRCIDENRSESSLTLPEMLHPSSDQLHTMKLAKKDRVSSLSMVLLVRIAQVSIPPEISAPLVKVYQEAYDIIHFVEERIVSMSFQNRKESELAKAVWRGVDFSTILPRLGDSSSDGETFSSGSNDGDTYSSLFKLYDALEIMESLKIALPPNTVGNEVRRIIDIIKNGFDRSTVKNLYRIMEESFFDMLHELLVELPHAIYKEVTESSAENFDTRVRLCLGILCKVQPINEHIRWSFPVVGCDATCLIIAPRIGRADAGRDTVADARIGRADAGRDTVADASIGRDIVADARIGGADAGRVSVAVAIIGQDTVADARIGRADAGRVSVADARIGRADARIGLADAGRDTAADARIDPADVGRVSVADARIDRADVGRVSVADARIGRVDARIGQDIVADARIGRADAGRDTVANARIGRDTGDVSNNVSGGVVVEVRE